MPFAGSSTILFCSLLLLMLGKDTVYSVEGDEWTYLATGPDGATPHKPSDWYLGYPDCGMDAQSPINIAAGVLVDGKTRSPLGALKPQKHDLTFFPEDCDSTELIFKTNEFAWQVNYDACTNVPSLKFGREKYNLLQIHVHSPSEHTTGASLHSAEIHFVHVKDGTTDELLVVGVMLDTTKYGTNTELQSLWDVLNLGVISTSSTFTSSVYGVLPANPIYTYYIGSLTTPPCTQGVQWLVMTEPVIIGEQQLDDFRDSVASFPGSKVDAFGGTNRPTQPLNGRNVYHVAP